MRPERHTGEPRARPLQGGWDRRNTFVIGTPHGKSYCYL
jgi:hypothetical protein